MAQGLVAAGSQATQTNTRIHRLSDSSLRDIADLLFEMDSDCPSMPGTPLPQATWAGSSVREGSPPSTCDGRETRILTAPSSWMNTGGSFLCAQSRGSAGLFLCCKCGLMKPVAESVPKGSQIWCAKDINSYQALGGRWRTLPALKAWWTNLDQNEQRKLFIKWQGMNNQQRFNSIQYMEFSESTLEDLEDEVEKFETFADYKLRYPLMHDNVVQQNWLDTIEQNRNECVFRRNEWLVPRFAGIERRVRQRRAEGHRTERAATVDSETALQQFVQAGRERLSRAIDSQAPSVISPVTDAPVCNAGIVDMPLRPSVLSVMIESIDREVTELNCQISFLICILYKTECIYDFFVGIMYDYTNELTFG